MNDDTKANVKIRHGEDCPADEWMRSYYYVPAPPRCPSGGPRHQEARVKWAQANPKPACTCGHSELVALITALNINCTNL